MDCSFGGAGGGGEGTTARHQPVTVTSVPSFKHFFTCIRPSSHTITAYAPSARPVSLTVLPASAAEDSFFSEVAKGQLIEKRGAHPEFRSALTIAGSHASCTPTPAKDLPLLRLASLIRLLR